MVLEQTDANGKLRQAATEMHEFRGTEPVKALYRLLDAMQLVYMHELMHVDPALLQLKQGALRQVVELKRSLSSDSLLVPTI